MNSIRKTLTLYDVRPRKRLGQSFLKDMTAIRRIAALVEGPEEDTVVEIGAGLGLMTAELAKRARKVIAVEIDPRLVSALQDRFSADGRVEIVATDVMTYDFSSAAPGGKIRVVGNIPYHISTPILFRLLDFRASISEMVLMFQKELADRIMAGPGRKEYGIPSVIVGRYASVVRELTLPPNCFYPEPGVFSSVVRMTMHHDPETAEVALRFKATVRAAFSHRRKTLSNNLRAAGFPVEALASVFAETGIGGERRAETLSIEEFTRLAAALSPSGIAREIP
jgi:16S rRNA (adenine1518-N6/adenine1519-N6)-dimethyltransferase